jgi:hypothetical protein
LSDEEKELETAQKVVAIMQTITEDLDEPGKRAWRKMLGMADKPTETSNQEKDKKMD